eukprot:gene14390-19315_t
MLKNWVKEQQELIDLEHESESAQLGEKISFYSGKECQLMGLSLLNLDIDGISTALFGRVHITLMRIDRGPIVNSFKVGDEVSLYNPKIKSTIAKDDDSATVDGLVSRVSSSKITIVVDEFDDHKFDPPLRLDMRASQRTHDKMKQALSSLVDSKHRLVDLLFSPKKDDLPFQQNIQPINLNKIWNKNLNDSQLDAIKCGLGVSHVSVIHGPPGTGKTSTLTELIIQAVTVQNLKVLVCAPSNVAVDTILSRLADISANQQTIKTESNKNLPNNNRLALKMLRIGHPARLNPKILPFSLDYQITDHEGTEIVKDVKKDAEIIQKELSKNNKGKRLNKTIKTEKRKELKMLTKEIKTREKTIVHQLIQHSQIIFATCIGASSNLLNDIEFDLIVIDEAAQALEAACWVPILKGSKLILAGDHCQLPPTIKSAEAEKRGLNITLFERIICDVRFNPIVRLLNTQYRMNELISNWASKMMYNNEIISDNTVAHHTMNDIVLQQNNDTIMEETMNDNLKVSADEVMDDLFPVMLLIDTSDCGMNEVDVSTASKKDIQNKNNNTNNSHRNVHEADLVHKHIINLLSSGVKPAHIGVITPYNGQLEILRDLIVPPIDEDTIDNNNNNSNNNGNNNISTFGIDVKTIDSFQGGEKECIILSLVRSNDRREVGFLKDSRRINVAVTRAKRHVVVICDASTCRHDPFIKSLIDHISEHGEHISALEYLDTFESMINNSNNKNTRNNDNNSNNNTKNDENENYSNSNYYDNQCSNTKTSHLKDNPITSVSVSNDSHQTNPQIVISSNVNDIDNINDSLIRENPELTSHLKNNDGKDNIIPNISINNGESSVLTTPSITKSHINNNNNDNKDHISQGEMNVSKNEDLLPLKQGHLLSNQALYQLRMENMQRKKLLLLSKTKNEKENNDKKVTGIKTNSFQQLVTSDQSALSKQDLLFEPILLEFIHGSIQSGVVQLLGTELIVKRNVKPFDGIIENKSQNKSKSGKKSKKINIIPTQPLSRVLQFPSSLSSYQRLKLHEACDKLVNMLPSHDVLTHESTGEGNNRHVNVKITTNHTFIGGNQNNHDNHDDQGEVHIGDLKNVDDYNPIINHHNLNRSFQELEIMEHNEYSAGHIIDNEMTC